MDLFYLSTIRTDSIPIFVNNWKGVFPLPDEAQYRERLHLKKQDAGSIRFLFDWKFRIPAGSKKEKFLFIITEKTEHIHQWKQQTSVEPSALFSQFPDLPSEWKIFLLHILRPGQFPLFSQYTLAAYAYITGQELKTVSRKRREKFYLETFVPFIRQEFYDIPMQKTDQALHAFGKFITEASFNEQIILK